MIVIFCARKQKQLVEQFLTRNPRAPVAQLALALRRKRKQQAMKAQEDSSDS
jgi:hypothetical protein